MTNETTEEPQEIIEIAQETFNEIVCLAFTTERYGRLLHYSLINLVNNCEEMSESWKARLSILKHFEELLDYSKKTTNALLSISGDDFSRSDALKNVTIH